VYQQVDGDSPARQPRYEIVADLDHDVVPAVRERPQRAIGQFRHLLGEEPAHQVKIDVDLGRWHRAGVHR
jgi:hypothetical protein